MVVKVVLLEILCSRAADDRMRTPFDRASESAIMLWNVLALLVYFLEVAIEELTIWSGTLEPILAVKFYKLRLVIMLQVR